MSLMNEALRKKNRELTGSPAAPGFSQGAQRPRATRRWLAVLAVLAAVVLLTAAALAGIHRIRSAAGNDLLVNNPTPTPSLPSANRSARPLTAANPPAEAFVEASSTGRQPTTDARGGAPPKTAQPATGHREATPAPTPIKGNGPDTRSTPRTPAMKPTAEKPVAEALPAIAVSTTTPVQPLSGNTAAASRAFEPGRDHPAQRKETMPAATATPRPPVITVSSTPPRTPAATIGEQKAGSRVEKTAQSGQDTDPFFQKAIIYHRSGRLVEAIRLYQQVLDSDSTHQDALLNLAAASIEQGNYTRAQRLLVRLEHTNPRPRGVLLNLAITAIGMDAPEAALAYLDRAEAIGDALPWEIHFHRAVAFARTDRLPEALALYREVEKERPDDPRLQFNLAVTCDALGLYPDALAHYEAVLQNTSGASENDSATITQRIRTIRRYLYTAQPPSKGQ